MADKGEGRHQQSASSVEEDEALLEVDEGSKELDEFEDVGDKEETLGDEDLLKDSDQDVVALAEADDLLEGTEGEQFEVLDSVGDSLLDEDDPKTSDKKREESGRYSCVCNASVCVPLSSRSTPSVYCWCGGAYVKVDREGIKLAPSLPSPPLE